MDNLKKIIPPEELKTLAPTKAWVHHHAFGAWGPTKWSCPETLEYYFGEVGDVETAVERTRFMQAEGYKAAFEEARRQWPYCSMAINWCFNEPWITAANNSLLEYPLKRKPAYYAVAQSLRPALASARIPKFDWVQGETFSAELWYLNDTDETVRETVKAEIIIGGETFSLLSWDSGGVAARTAKYGPTVRMIIPETDADRITLKLTAGKNTSSEYTLLLRKSENKPKEKILNM